MIPRLNILSICFLLVLLLTHGLCIAQDAKDVASQEATQGKVEAGEEKNLGGFFASTLQDILKQGKFFYPSDMTKKPGKEEGEEESEEEKTFKLNFKNAQIDQVLKFITEMTGKVVMRTDEVKGQFNLINPNEVTKEEAMRIIDTAFMLKGITYLETDMMFIVLTVAEAKQKGVEVSRAQQEGDMSSSMQHRIIELDYATPSQLQEALESLISENGNIIADDRTRTLVITETVSNLERIEA
ncbi:hypothetical protein GF373_03045, partial [bacterium]|nr:hypothetical protein [bacterium]